MNKIIIRNILKQISWQILILIIMTFVGLVGITYLLRPGNVSAILP